MREDGRRKTRQTKSQGQSLIISWQTFSYEIPENLHDGVLVHPHAPSETGTRNDVNFCDTRRHAPSYVVKIYQTLYLFVVEKDPPERVRNPYSCPTDSVLDPIHSSSIESLPWWVGDDRIRPPVSGGEGDVWTES